MSSVIPTEPPDNTAIGASRGRVLAVLQEADGPLGIKAICAHVGLHPNTARFHLDALIEQQLVERTTGARTGPGRPRALYKSSSEGTARSARRYGLLAQLLVQYIATRSDHPAGAALEAGEAWGRSVVGADGAVRSAPAAVSALTAVLSDYGFAPEPVTTSDTRLILLHHCPFREAAEANRDVVCAVHLGLMRGVLAELTAPVRVDSLEPFVEPNLCIARLAG